MEWIDLAYYRDMY